MQKNLKIVATVADAAMAANVGGPVETNSALIEIPWEQVPQIIKGHLEHKQYAIENKQAIYTSLTFSLLSE